VHSSQQNLPPSNIPNVIHFVHGLSPKSEDREFELVHYLAVRAAKDRLNPDRMFVHFLHEPTGEWWNTAKPLVTPFRMSHTAVLKHAKHRAHKADFVRLLILAERGGVYLDMDVLVLRQIDGLKGTRVILGEEGPNGAFGLSNAIMATPPGSNFIKVWYAEMSKTFSNKKWNDHSIQLPKRLAKNFRGDITILSHIELCWPLWDAEGLSRLYLSNDCEFTRTSLTVHLWHSKVNRYLSKLTTDSILRYETCFTQLARNILPSESLPRRHLDFQSLVLFIHIHDLDSANFIKLSWCRVAQYYGARLILHSHREDHLRQLRLYNDELEFVLTHVQDKRSIIDHAESLSREDNSTWYVFLDSTVLINLIGLRDSLRLCDSFQQTGTYKTCISAQEEFTSTSLLSGPGCVAIYTSDSLTQDYMHLVPDVQCTTVSSLNLKSSDFEVDCRHFFADILTGLGVAYYHIVSRLMYLSGLPSADKLIKSVHESGRICRLEDVIDLLREFSSRAKHTTEIVNSLDTKLVVVPRKLDFNLCHYTGRPCSANTESNRTQCQESNCCYDPSKRVKCFTKFAPGLPDSGAAIAALQKGVNEIQFKAKELRYDEAVIDDKSPLAAAATILAYYEAGLIVSVDDELQKSGDELMLTLAQKRRANIKIWASEYRR